MCMLMASPALNPALGPAQELELELKAAQLREEDSEAEVQRQREALEQCQAEAGHLRQAGLGIPT